MKYILVLLSILVCFPCTAGRASEKIAKNSILSGGQSRTYYVFAPKTLTATRPAPLIITLHGSGHNGLSLVEKWKDLATKEEIIVVGPDSQDSKTWYAPVDGPDFLRDVVQALKTKYPVDPRRVYLFGHSGGAVFALVMSLLESEYFAAAAVHAGAFRDPREYAVIDSAQRKIPLAIWVGENDTYFPPADVRATRDALKARGFSVEVTEISGHDHWYYDMAPKINRSAWEFLRKQQLAADPQYHPYSFK